MSKYYIATPILLAAVLVSFSVAYAKIKPVHQITSAYSGNQVAFTPSTAQSKLEAEIASRLSQYSLFEANMPSSLSANDQTILRSELSGSIAQMRTTLAALKSATTTSEINKATYENASTSQADSLLSLKMNMLQGLFRVNITKQHHFYMSSSTTRIASTNSAATTTIAFVPLFTSSISSNSTDQIIQLNSLTAAAALQKEISTENFGTLASSTNN